MVVAFESLDEAADGKAAGVALTWIKRLVHVPGRNLQEGPECSNLEKLTCIGTCKDPFALLVDHTLKKSPCLVNLIKLSTRENGQENAQASKFAGPACKEDTGEESSRNPFVLDDQIGRAVCK